MLTPAQIAEKFQALDIHDDTVESFRFVPAGKRGTNATLEVTLYRHWKNTRRLLIFRNCANFQVALDADVLQDNAPNNTCDAKASTAASEILGLMRQQKRSWNVSYQKSIDPLQRKLDSAERYVLFRVGVFGGVLQIIARTFSTRRIAAKASV